MSRSQDNNHWLHYVFVLKRSKDNIIELTMNLCVCICEVRGQSYSVCTEEVRGQGHMIKHWLMCLYL